MLELGEGEERACGKSPLNILVSNGYTVRPQGLGKRWVFVCIFRERGMLAILRQDARNLKGVLVEQKMYILNSLVLLKQNSLYM